MVWRSDIATEVAGLFAEFDAMAQAAQYQGLALHRGKPAKSRGTCKYGHPRTPENTTRDASTGYRRCLKCRRETWRKYEAKRAKKARRSHKNRPSIDFGGGDGA